MIRMIHRIDTEEPPFVRSLSQKKRPRAAIGYGRGSPTLNAALGAWRVAQKGREPGHCPRSPLGDWAANPREKQSPAPGSH